MKLKIAVVQLEIKQFAPEENFKRIETFTKEASKKNAKIIVFPEDCLTGPLGGRMEFADSEKKYLEGFRKIAKKYKIDIVTGSFIEKEKTGFFNTTYYVDKKGKIKSKYRKINLWHPEKKYLNPGKEISVFNTPYGKIGLTICWDLMYPEIFRKMISKGVQIIFCPSYWTLADASKGIEHDKNSEIHLVDSLSVGRAFENEIIFVYCNGAGKIIFPNFKEDMLGHSQITIPFKGALRRLNHNREEMFIQEVDTLILKDAEKAYKIKSDLSKRVY